MSLAILPDPESDSVFCSIQRALNIVGERWTFLILREALIEGETKFADFENLLHVAPNILSDRLRRLVEAGILEKRTYKEAGSRPRYSYHPTAEGLELKLVLAALQQWGDDHVPHPTGATQSRVTAQEELPVRLAFVDSENRPRELAEVVWINNASYPTELRAANKAGKR
jgi:DNA-binding HxlR family transcriptional regulator